MFVSVSVSGEQTLGERDARGLALSFGRVFLTAPKFRPTFRFSRFGGSRFLLSFDARFARYVLRTVSFSAVGRTLS